MSADATGQGRSYVLSGKSSPEPLKKNPCLENSVNNNEKLAEAGLSVVYLDAMEVQDVGTINHVPAGYAIQDVECGAWRTRDSLSSGSAWSLLPSEARRWARKYRAIEAAMRDVVASDAAEAERKRSLGITETHTPLRASKTAKVKRRKKAAPRPREHKTVKSESKKKPSTVKN